MALATMTDAAPISHERIRWAGYPSIGRSPRASHEVRELVHRRHFNHSGNIDEGREGNERRNDQPLSDASLTREVWIGGWRRVLLHRGGHGFEFLRSAVQPSTNRSSATAANSRKR